MRGETKWDRIRNESTREKIGITPIVEKMAENRLMWFAHVVKTIEVEEDLERLKEKLLRKI